MWAAIFLNISYKFLVFVSLLKSFINWGGQNLGLEGYKFGVTQPRYPFLQKCFIWLEMNFEHVFRSVTFGASLTPSPLQVFNKCYTFWRLPILEKIDLLLQITFSRGIWVILTLNVLANNPTNFARPLCCYKNYPKPVKSLSFCKLRPVGEISEKHCSRKSLKISKKWSIGPYNGLTWSLNISSIARDMPLNNYKKLGHN